MLVLRPGPGGGVRLSAGGHTVDVIITATLAATRGPSALVKVRGSDRHIARIVAYGAVQELMVGPHRASFKVDRVTRSQVGLVFDLPAAVAARFVRSYLTQELATPA